MSSTNQKTNHSVPTKYWHVLPDGRVQCDVCPRHCRLHEGQQGLCFVRACHDQSIVMTSYGLSSGFCIDPIEKKPLNHYYPGTPVLSFGTAGCNLACKFCQNWDMSKSREMHTLADAASPEQLAQAALASGCRHIAYTYNDPLIFMEYAIDVAQCCHEYGINAVAVTAGYVCDQPRREFFQSMDAANVDLKAFTQRFYKKVCGGSLSDVLDTLLYLKHDTSVWFEITTLLIPGENDSTEELSQQCRWIADNLGCDVPLHFTAFHPDWKMLDKTRTPLTTLSNARQIAHEHGLNFVYTGNVHDIVGASTYCANCAALLIERDGYQLGEWGINAEGKCYQCDTKLSGFFDAQPGQWGSCRMPIRMC